MGVVLVLGGTWSLSRVQHEQILMEVAGGCGCGVPEWDEGGGCVWRSTWG